MPLREQSSFPLSGPSLDVGVEPFPSLLTGIVHGRFAEPR